MPSTYTLNNGIELIGTGEQSGTWGSTTNTNLELLDTALDGQVTVTLSSTGSSGSPNALPISDGSNSNGRNRLVIFNDGSDLGGTAYVQLTPNDAEKIIYVRNSLSGSRSILLFQGTYNASNDYEVPAGTTAVVFFNGGGTGAVAANVFNNAHFDALNVVGSVTVGGGVTVTGTVDAGTVEFDNLSGTGAVSVTNILDEDNMASNSATALSTQQSIKAYVDSQVGTVDTLAEILANGNTTGGNDIVFSAGDNISNASGDFTLDVAGDISLDSDSGYVLFKDAGTEHARIFQNNSGDVNISSQISDKDMKFLGNDGGSTVTALTLDMSEAGRAIFNADANMADGNAFRFGDNQDFLIYHSSNQNIIQANTTDQDIIFKGVDNGSSITALTLDMSGAGAASFNVGGVFNESGADSDFRVESDNDTHMLFVDASTSRIGLITSAPAYTLDVLGQGRFRTSNNDANLILECTDADANRGPFLNLARDNSSAADGDRIGCIIFNADDDSNNQTEYAAITGFISDASNTTEDGGLLFDTATAGNPAIEKLRLGPTAAVFNEGGADVDFRVESNNNANMLFVDAGNDQVGIGTNAMNSYYAKDLVVMAPDEGGITIAGDGSNETQYLMFADGTSGTARYSGYIQYEHNGDKLIFAAAGQSRLMLTSTEFLVNNSSLDQDFRVESDARSNMFVVDGGVSQIGVGMTPDQSWGSNSVGINFGIADADAGWLGWQQIAGADNFHMLWNVYHDNSDFRYASNNPAGKYTQNSGSHLFSHAANGSADAVISFIENLRMTSSGAVFNEGSNDLDFRVESNANSHMLFVDAGANSGAGRVTIGGSNQAGVLTVNGGTTTEQSMWVYGQATGKGGRILSIRDTRATSGTEGSAGIHLTSSPGTDYVLAKYYDGSVSNFMLTDQTGNEYITVEAAANIVINQAGSSGKDFRVESTSKAHMLFIDAAENAVGINDGDPKSYPSGTQTGSATDGGQFRIGGSVGAVCASGTGNELAWTRSGLNYISSPNGGFRIRAGTSGGVNLSTTATSWTSASDERLKTLTGDIENAAEKVKTLRTKMGRYNEDPEDVSRPFLIAQDVQAVLPEAVSVIEDDPEIADTTGISDKLFLSYTDVIPLLTAALKESIAKNEELEARITALENA
jgi:hypothetical protein